MMIVTGKGFTLEQWQEATLWNEVERRGADSRAYLVLRTLMPVIEETLRAGVPASPDFTLHDNEHGFRVAQLIARLVDNGMELLSDVEVSLLLLASYCHDIGMSPRREKVRNHFNYLITADPSLLSPVEVGCLQTWLDSNWSGLTAPVERDAMSSSGLLLAEEINAYYCRSRHNDWSEEWIRAELGHEPHSLYAGWIDDLVTLCRSHHEGLAQLRQPRFDARLVGAPPNVLNLRFLAALLRVADVMEFAPERTPDVVLRHRNIAPKSRIYWFKDHSISFSLEPDSGKILFSARTPSAAIHKAVLMTADWVDQELATCSTLEQEGAFRRGTIPESARTNYAWPWTARLTSDIQERGGSFVYIEGAFRPDSNRILSLLSGTALYHDPMVAIRELIQNAMDAVKEQVAYERLQSSDPSDERTAAALAELHWIRLTYSRDEDGYWLRCVDDGSGMTKSIIERSLLVSGSSTRGDVRALERDAKLNGFSIGRTGQFGIGVLSYFMLSDKMIILSRRSQEAGDTDGVAWRFSTEGIGAFGELSQDSRGSRGTDLSLRIKSSVLGNSPDGWFQKVVEYVERTVRLLPCRLEFRDEVRKVVLKSRGPGWTVDHANYQDEVLARLITSPGSKSDMITEEDKASIALHLERRDDVIKKAAKALRWTTPVEFRIDIPETIGRAWLPYVDLVGGASAIFMDIRRRRVIPGPDNTSGFLLPTAFNASWRGIRINASRPGTSRAFVDIDHRSDRVVSVDRNSFVDASCDSTERTIAGVVEDVWLGFLRENSTSLYNELNVAVSRVGLRRRAQLLRRTPKWPVRRGIAREMEWSDVQCPLFDLGRISFYAWDHKDFVHDDIPINEAARINTQQHSFGHTISSLYGGGSLTQFGICAQGGFVGLRWSDPSEFKALDGRIGAASAEFPPSWNGIAVALGPVRAIFNSNHPVVRAIVDKNIPPSGQTKASEVEADLRHAASSRASAALFMVANFSRALKFWIFLAESHGSLLKEVLEILGIRGRGELMVLRATELFKDDHVVDIYDVAFSGAGCARNVRPPKTGPLWEIHEQRK